MSELDLTIGYVAVDGGNVRWLGPPIGVAAWAARLGCDSLVVWRVDTLAGKVERVLVHRAGDEDQWRLTGEDGREIHAVDVEESVDPLVLAVIEQVSALRPIQMLRVRPRAWVEVRDSYARWGFTHPEPAEFAHPSVGFTVARFCPELIAAQARSAGIDGLELRHYTNAMYLRIVWCADRLADVTDEDAREAKIDDLLYEWNPHLLGLVSKVQAAALDEEPR